MNDLNLRAQRERYFYEYLARGMLKVHMINTVFNKSMIFSKWIWENCFDINLDHCEDSVYWISKYQVQLLVDNLDKFEMHLTFHSTKDEFSLIIRCEVVDNNPYLRYQVKQLHY